MSRHRASATSSCIPYWSEDGRLIAAVDQERDDQVTVFDVDSGRKLWSSPPLGSRRSGCVLARRQDARGRVSRGRVGTSEVTLWAIGEWDRSRSFVLPGSAGIGVEFIRGGDVLVTTSDVAGRSRFR